MQNPAYLPLAGDRYAPFVRELPFLGYDFTGATFAMQVRLTPDTPGTPLIDLGTVTSATDEGLRLVYGGTDTVANHVAAGRLFAEEVPSDLEEGDSLALSLVGIRILEATMRATGTIAMAGLEPASDAEIAHDIQITPLAGDKDVWARGPFTIRAGVTQ